MRETQKFKKLGYICKCTREIKITYLHLCLKNSYPESPNRPYLNAIGAIFSTGHMVNYPGNIIKKINKTTKPYD